MEFKKVDTLEETLNGKWSGLHGEVVTEDCYRLRQLNFVPNVVFDLGSNVGTATRFFRELFPYAKIIAIEPHPENFFHLKKFTPNDDNIVFINKAIGRGQIFHALTASNGSGECYLSEGLGYENVVDNESIERINTIETVMPDEIINQYLKEGDLSILKLDIEGAENIIWDHEPSMIALSKIDYICAEIHRYANDGSQQELVNQKTAESIERLSQTHDIEWDHVHLYARKKK